MADIDEILMSAEERMEKAITALKENFMGVRTGRANAMVLDRIKVDYYGVPTPVNQMAGVKTPEAHLLVIEPWDKGMLRAIEHAILESDLGVTPNNDGSVIRLPFPSLTEERRRDLVKQCKTYAEEARVAVRNARRDANTAIEKAVKNDNLPEDESKRAEAEIQKMTDRFVAEVDEVLKKKEAEVMEIEGVTGFTDDRWVGMNKDLDYIFPDPPEGVDPRALDPERIPESVAIIMDGNGRWAKKRALNRLKGHKAGIEAVREAIRCASDLGVRYLTIYSFSTENWKRPEDEVVGLMDLFAKTMLAEVDGLHEEGVRVRTIGDLSALPAETREAFDEAWEKTRDNDGMTLVVAVNYGGRQEILRACRGCMREAVLLGEETGEVIEPTEEMFERGLYTFGMPDPDLVIRTSGEMRISNFLLWQIAYSEFVVTDVLWPDFNRYTFLECLLEYQGRNRRFGGVA